MSRSGSGVGAGDPLERLASTVDIEMFRADHDVALGRPDRSKGGRPPFDPVLKFRMLVLQAMHGLSLAQTEYLVADRLTSMRFCRLGPGDGVPDANTLWDFREALIAAGAFEALFAKLDRAINAAGYLPMSGQIVDATLVAAPRQRLTGGEKAAIKEGRTAPEIWPDKVLQGQAGGGRLGAGRHRGADVRRQERHRGRPPARDHPPTTASSYARA